MNTQLADQAISRSESDRGIALIAVMLMMSVLMTMLAAYSVLTRLESTNALASARSTRGFYAAEGGLNVRSETIRQKFTHYEFPEGDSPLDDADHRPCSGGNDGTEDFACDENDFGLHKSLSYVIEDTKNPYELTIPPGERFQNLSASEYRYSVVSRGMNRQDEVEAMLELRFKSRLVPMFQFAAFYNKDLEINNGPTMALGGPIHTNGNLYLGPDGSNLALYGQITAAGDIYRGRKDQIDECRGNVYITYPAPNPINVATPSGCNISNCQLNVCSGSNRAQITQTMINKYNGLVQLKVPPLEIPEPEAFDPTPSGEYWSKADLRLVLQLNSSDAITGVQVRDVGTGSYGTNSAAKTSALLACTGGPSAWSNRVVSSSTSMINRRENAAQNRILLEVDLRALLNCLHTTNWFGTGKKLDDNSEDGLVFYLTVQGPNSASQSNRYGFRIRNAAQLQASVAGAPAVKGLSIVSDQAAYITGDYNSTNWTRSAVMVDSFNVLSNAWISGNFDGAAYASRNASTTTIQVAILAGTDTTGGPNASPALEGAAGESSSTNQTAYNGGLENYPRFHENWAGVNFTYVGSFVSLNRPKHVNGIWGTANVYSPPNRIWSFDSRFNDPKKLPPMTPRFVYLRQELFLRDFDQQG